jgi:hypothetical protein
VAVCAGVQQNPAKNRHLAQLFLSATRFQNPVWVGMSVRSPQLGHTAQPAKFTTRVCGDSQGAGQVQTPTQINKCDAPKLGGSAPHHHRDHHAHTHTRTHTHHSTIIAPVARWHCCHGRMPKSTSARMYTSHMRMHSSQADARAYTRSCAQPLWPSTHAARAICTECKHHCKPLTHATAVRKTRGRRKCQVGASGCKNVQQKPA